MQTSAGLGWHGLQGHMQVPGTTVMMNPVNTKCVTGTCDPGYGLYTNSEI